MSKKNVGSSFDSFLEDEGIKDEVDAGARRAVAEFEQEMAAEDAAKAQEKLMECGHPLTAVVTSGKGPGATSFCSICEADARALSSFGEDCVVCEKAIDGSHYNCMNYGSEPVCCECHDKMIRHVCVYVCDDLPTEGLAYSYDQDTDTLTVEGIKYAGDVFRTLGFAPVGTVLRIEEREDGRVTVRRLNDG